MPDFRRANCQRCQRNRDECGHISWGGLCQRCSNEQVAANVLGLMAKDGPEFEHWLRRSYMAARKQLVAFERGEA